MKPDVQNTFFQMGPHEHLTEIVSNGGDARLSQLCGVFMERHERGSAPQRVAGMACFTINGRRLEGKDLGLISVDHSEQSVICHWQVGGDSLRLDTIWNGDTETGVVSRCDSLTNTGDTAIILSRCLARFVLPRGRYETYTQESRWCHESQGSWQTLRTGQVTLRNAPGRTTEEGTPYLAIRSEGADEGLAFHVLPCGNWVIHVDVVTTGGELPYLVVELGLADTDLHLALQPGELLALPEIIIQPLPHGEPHRGAPLLHHYLLDHQFKDAKPDAPIVYNTWFDQFDILELERLHKQLITAKEIGCEVFTVDAGWYGAGGPNWSAQTGDWREKQDAAFHGEMRVFADEVRAAGLGFGLWMEPERFGADAPVRVAHPEWFIPLGDMARIDLAQPDAYSFIRDEIARLVETYELAWMKLDFNFGLGTDASGTELHTYYSEWYRLLDNIHAAYPQTFFEGCSSGAMRADIHAVSHVDGHFLSDSVDPVDMLRISQGTWLRLPPGRLTRWAVLRSGGRTLPVYGKTVAASPTVVLTPCGATWERAETVDPKFAMMVALPGMFGLSGDLAGLDPEVRTPLQQGVNFAKRWRRFITGTVAYLLTPPEPLERRTGWVAVQLQQPGNDVSLVFIYRLGFAGDMPRVCLHGLDSHARYSIKQGLDEKDLRIVISGNTLTNEGLPPDMLRHCDSGPANSAEVFVIARLPEQQPSALLDSADNQSHCSDRKQIQA